MGDLIFIMHTSHTKLFVEEDCRSGLIIFSARNIEGRKDVFLNLDEANELADKIKETLAKVNYKTK